MDKKEIALVLFLAIFIIANLANIAFILSVDAGGRTSARASYGELSLYIVSPTAPTPTPTPTPVTGGGGGGRIYHFSVDQNLIEVMIHQGETFKTSLKIKNTESASQEFKISTNLEDYLIFSEDSFVLAGGEERVVYLTFFSTSDTIPGAYPGKIIVKTNTNKKEVPVILTIKSKKVLFDLSLNIPAKYKELVPGDDLVMELILFNLAGIEKTDVSIEYFIKDFDGNLITSWERVASVETQASFSETTTLPRDIKPGDYVAIAYVRYDDSLGSSSDVFHIVEKKISPIYLQYIPVVLILSFFVIIVGIFFFFFDVRLKRMIREQNREIEWITRKLRGEHLKLAEAVRITERLKLQLSILNQAYSKGYISRPEYFRNKDRLRGLYARARNKILKKP